MKEKPQSLESQLQLARPRRREIERVPLTPEEKEFLGKIMHKAVAAEKAGKLAEALGFYTDYRDELLKIKAAIARKKKVKAENNIIWTQEKLEKWVKDIFGPPKHRMTLEEMTGEIFDLHQLPKLETVGDLDLDDCGNVKELPDNLTVYGDLCLRYTNIIKLPKNLCIKHNFIINGIEFEAKKISFPESIRIDGDLVILGLHSSPGATLDKLIMQADILKATGKLKGKIVFK